MKKLSVILILISFFSQLTGFIREVVISFFYGASSISDAYYIALTIPMMFYAFIGKAISTSYIPIYSDVEKKSGKESAFKLTNNVINVSIVVCIFFIIFTWVFTPQIIKILASGFSGESYDFAVNFTRIMIFGTITMVTVNVYSVFLQYNNKYIFPAFNGVLLNFIVIGSTIISALYNNPLILPLGTLFGMMMQTIFLNINSKKMGLKKTFDTNFRSQEIRSIYLLSLPVILGVGVNEINLLIDRTLASRVEGGVSILNYANKLNGLVYGIFVFSLITILYPAVVKAASSKNFELFKSKMNDAFIWVLLLVTPATFGLIFLSHEIISFIYGRGEFSTEDQAVTSVALQFYSIGVLAVSLRLIISRGYYALQDTKTPAVNGIYGLILNAVLNIILFNYLGLIGIPLATSLSSWITLFLLLTHYKNKMQNLYNLKIIKIFSKSIIASIITGLTAKIVSNFLDSDVGLILSVILSSLIYFTCMLLLKVNEFDDLILWMKKMKKYKFRK